MENNNVLETKIVNKSKKLPKPGTYTRAVVERWIMQGGRIRAHEAASAYCSAHRWCRCANKHSIVSVSSILKRYGSKPESERCKHTDWILDPQWLPAVPSSYNVPSGKRVYAFKAAVTITVDGESYTAARANLRKQLEDLYCYDVDVTSIKLTNLNV